MRHRSLGLIATALVLTGCSAGGSDEPPGSTTSTPSTPAGIASALERVSADARGDSLYVEYGNSAVLTDLAAEKPEAWQFIFTYGLSALAPLLDGSTVLGMDLSAADYALTVGEPPARLMLVAGGQDGAAVTETAEQLGYSGDPVLSQEMDVKVRETITVHSLVILDEDVALAGPEADLEWVDSNGDSMLDDESVAALAGCLGDPAAAMLLDVDGTEVGLAIRATDSQTESVLCLAGDQNQADTIVDEIESGSTTNGMPYSEQFESASAEVSDGVIRVVLDNSENAPPNRIFMMAQQRDLPLG